MTTFADPALEERGWRALEELRPNTYRVTWVCRHNPRVLVMPQRSHSPGTEQRQFGHTSLIKTHWQTLLARQVVA